LFKAFLLSIISFFIGYYIFGYTNFVSVKTINISGCIRLKSNYLIKRSGITKDDNMIFINLRKSKEQLLKEPYIKDVELKQKLLNTIDIKIEERTPIAAVPYMGSYIIIDEEGVALNVEDDFTELDKPIITGIVLEDMSLGHKIKIKKDENFFYKLISLLNVLKNTKLLESISEIKLDANDEFILYTIYNMKIYIGNCTSIDYKIRFIQKILVDLYSKGIKSGEIDFSYEGNPVYRAYNKKLGSEVLEEKK
jgi:cell division protein FtsQ